MDSQYVVEVDKPPPEAQAQVAKQVAHAFKVDLKKAEGLLKRVPGVVTKPVSEQEAKAVAKTFERAGLAATVRAYQKGAAVQEPPSAKPQVASQAAPAGPTQAPQAPPASAPAQPKASPQPKAPPQPQPKAPPPQPKAKPPQAAPPAEPQPAPPPQPKAAAPAPEPVAATAPAESVPAKAAPAAAAAPSAEPAAAPPQAAAAPEETPEDIEEPAATAHRARKGGGLRGRFLLVGVASALLMLLASLGTIIMTVPENLLETVLMQTLIIGLVPILLAILIAILLSRAVTNTISQLVEAADRISRGELDESVDIRSNDELGELARSIERMRVSLQEAMERLRRRR